MFVTLLNRGQYTKKKLSLKKDLHNCYQNFELPLGGVFEQNGKKFKPVIVVELLSRTVVQCESYQHQVWINRNDVWYNVDNESVAVYPMPREPTMPTLIVYQQEGKDIYPKIRSNIFFINNHFLQERYCIVKHFMVKV